MDPRVKKVTIVVIPLVACISLILAFIILQNPAGNYEVINSDEFNYKGIDILWLDIAGFRLKSNNTVVYIDPINIQDYIYSTVNESMVETNMEKADYIIITHSHTPHSSASDIQKISDNETVILSSINPGDKLEYENVSFEFVPSYNVDKYRPAGELYHPPGFNWVGVIVDFGDVRVYHAGDTDRIPEMKDIITDIALLPVSGFAWMTSSEAAGAVKDLKINSDLKYAIPMHYGPSSTGSEADAINFSKSANCDVVILEPMFG
ncbi:MAG: MBL fold metallo-hydrolase [Candidatus Hodarchaeales archaeon]|jgi:L-ascorbate metabolism protein UlaG (beta-lactamase superfamily)